MGLVQGAAQHGAAGMLQGKVRGPGDVGQAQCAGLHEAAGMLLDRESQATWGQVQGAAHHGAAGMLQGQVRGNGDVGANAGRSTA